MRRAGGWRSRKRRRKAGSEAWRSHHLETREKRTR
uniref:Uncharacterized protein n=1 Tax=Arundo donax TaxID=35708 RepID=A0A0A8Y7H9_ARUDO